ncbi:MAG: Asp-tRNA(Asn)/Glu-tRNA(Gln) amidotransferase subunit GatC [Gammaproteobacteria bacterium]
MSIDISSLKQTAHLARLDFSETELLNIQQDLHKILDMVNTIQQTNTQGVEPIAHATDNAQQPLRDDVVTEPNLREVIQALTPHKMAGLYLVPKVIE